MKRRGFLKALVGAAAAIAVPWRPKTAPELTLDVVTEASRHVATRGHVTGLNGLFKARYAGRVGHLSPGDYVKLQTGGDADGGFRFTLHHENGFTDAET